MCLTCLASKTVRYFSPMKEFIQHCLKFSCVTYAGAFGAPTCKPFIIRSTSSLVHKLNRPKPKNLATLCYYDAARESTTGNKRDLSSSQAYPYKFGDAVAELFKEELDTKADHIWFGDDVMKPTTKKAKQPTAKKAKEPTTKKSNEPTTKKAKKY